MNDDFLNQFRKAPRPDFAKALYARIADQVDPAASPVATVASDGHKLPEDKTPGGISTMNAIATSTIEASRPARWHQGHLVIAFATLLAILFGGLLFASSYRDPVGTPFSVLWSPEDNMAVFERYIEEVWNNGDVLVLDELLTADHLRHEPGVPDVEGIDGVTIYIQAFRTAFPDTHFTIADIGADGDRVWARLVMTGTNTGLLRLEDGTVVPPTGNPITLESMTIARFEDGKIAELWNQADVMGVFQQLDVVPPVGELVAEAQHVEIARRVFEDLLNGANLDSVESLYDPGFPRFYMPNNEGDIHMSANTWRLIYQGMHEAMPDLQATVERVFVENDVVVVHYTAQGTLEGGTSNTPNGNRLPATGELETWDGVILFRVEAGLIVEEWWYWDNPVYAIVDYCE